MAFHSCLLSFALFTVVFISCFAYWTYSYCTIWLLKPTLHLFPGTMGLWSDNTGHNESHPLLLSQWQLHICSHIYWTSKCERVHDIPCEDKSFCAQDILPGMVQIMTCAEGFLLSAYYCYIPIVTCADGFLLPAYYFYIPIVNWADGFFHPIDYFMSQQHMLEGIK